jgi:hypothetical protein
MNKTTTVCNTVAAFKERRKIHDIVLEGIELALRKRGRKNR